MLFKADGYSELIQSFQLSLQVSGLIDILSLPHLKQRCTELSNTSETCLPTTAWFLYSEVEDESLGRVYRRDEPEVGGQIEAGQGNQAGEIISFEELRATCAMRRFKVILRSPTYPG